MLTGLWNLEDIQNSCKNCSKNKLVRENAVTRAHGSRPLGVMGSCRLPPVLEFVVSSVSCSERFFSSYSGFCSPQSGKVNEEPLCGCATTKLLFIYLFIHLPIHLFIYSFIIILLIDSKSSTVFLPLILLNLLGIWSISVWGGMGWF